MSRPASPVRADASSIATIRGLLERNLLDRAVAASERRWPGSGPLVRLSYEWAQLPPTDRRDGLASIGPEELARLRTVADLQPDLARVLDDLEERGIIPPMLPEAHELSPVEETLTREEQVVDAVLDLAEQHVNERIVDLQPRVDSLRQRLQAVDVDPRIAPLVWEIAAATAPVAMAETGTTDEFLAEQVQQRLRSAERATEALGRIQASIERSATRMGQRPTEPIPMLLTEPGSFPAMPTVTPSLSASVTERGVHPSRQEERASEIVALLRAERIVTVEGDEDRHLNPASLAASLDSPYTILVPHELGRRAFYGGLTREGREVLTQPGAFSRALSVPGLTIVCGRLLPSIVRRLREGYCDIPGTNATTLVHPEARVLVMAD